MYFILFGRAFSGYWLSAGIGLVFAILLALLRRRAIRFHTSFEDVLYTLLLGLAGGVIGAKTFQLIGYIVRDGTNPGFWTLENWIQLIPGVGVLYGGLIGGLIAALIFIRKCKLDFFDVSDILVPPLLLFFTFGRVGCFLGGCCHGRETDLGIAIYGMIPVQLFEAGFTLLFMIALLVIRPERKLPGILLPLYLMVYAVGRFVLEFFRGDMGRGVFLLSTSQWISRLVLPAGILLLWWTRKQNFQNALNLQEPSDVI